ncbi:MAG TPA: DUF6292 family protein [Actinophytocola sp.]|uniref:DUF6292 family protein n=1 Tax=Actinophytocola sp. TaxID=1872138 RepID=UPI002DB9E8F6|nr:DUF6292 family protein [Actinophytocola sp.]HEU5473613.1 DUF6292 family protein [Actinophytocola sp.]
MDPGIDGALASGLRHYVALVAEAIELSGPGWTVQLDSPVSVYLPLDARLPAFPTRDTALVWHELHGWALAVETGEDRMVVAYHGLDVLPPPHEVAEFTTRLLTATTRGPGPGNPPHLRAPDDAGLTRRLAAYLDPRSAPSPLSTRLVRDASATVLHVTGEVDMATETILLAAVAEALTQRPPVLVIDLTDVTFLASAGLHVLLHAHRTATNTKIRIVAAAPNTQYPLHLTGLDTQLTIYPTLRQALADQPLWNGADER